MEKEAVEYAKSCIRTPIGAMTFDLVYRVDALLPVEVETPTL